MLCKTCTLMFQSLQWGSHHADPASLADAAANGCFICKPLLQYAVEQCGNLDNCVGEPWGYRVYQYEIGTQVIIDMNLSKGGEVIEYFLSMMAVPSSTFTFNPAIRSREVSLPLLDAIASSERWLRECLDGHDQCPRNTQPSSYPKRLLKLEGLMVRLISPGEENISGPYVALSYCPSSNPLFLHLSGSNLQEFESGISYVELPVAFQEAIGLLKGLSICYLWIDALCTISGSETSENIDWDTKHDIYINSMFTLSLTRAKNPHESCLGGCPPNAMLPFQVESTGLFGQDPAATCTCTVVYWDYYQKSLYDLPLGFRTEAVQERLLSPRVLSFSLRELFWDCVQRPNASETLPDGPADLASHFKLWQKAMPKTADQKKLKEFWWQILEEYTDCEPAHSGADKLAGLSAIANQLATAMDDVYIAGHFWKTLPASLNWQVQPLLVAREQRGGKAHPINKTGDRQPPVPSWSWASMNGSLYIYRGH